MADENIKIVGRPYHDLSNPFTVDESGAFAEYIIQDPDSMSELALGANVIIKDRRVDHECWIAGRIVGLRAISPFNPDRENMLYVEDEEIDPTRVLDEVTGPHTHQPMVIRVKLDRELMSSVGTSVRRFETAPVQRPPSALSRMMFPEIVPVKDNAAPSLQEILEIKDEGIPLGAVGFGNTPYESKGTFLEYKWDVDKLVNKHVFIVGESGSGKTVFLKNLAYELRKHNPNNRIILTDVQGDITQLLLHDVAAHIQPRGWQTKVEREPVADAVKRLEKFQLVIPARKNGNSEGTVALKALAQRRGVTVTEVGLRLQDLGRPSDVEYLFKVTSDQVGMLLDEEADALSNGSRAASLANLRGQLNSRISSAGNSNNAQVASGGGTMYYVSTFRAALRALRSLEEYFDYHQSSLSQSNNPLDCFDFDGTTILFLDELDQDERIMWEMQLLKWLYEHKKDSWQAFVFVDEAHQVIPAKPMGIGSIETFDRLRVNFERLAREGRKFGINLVLSTQNPKDLHPIVPDQCHTKIVMKLNEKNAAAAFLDPELAPIANRFSSGQFWIQSIDNGSPNWVRVHSWAAPLPHEGMTTFWEKVQQKAREEASSSAKKRV
jgi:DNA helicase HerA-like ATPase